MKQLIEQLYSENSEGELVVIIDSIDDYIIHITGTLLKAEITKLVDADNLEAYLTISKLDSTEQNQLQSFLDQLENSKKDSANVTELKLMDGYIKTKFIPQYFEEFEIESFAKLPTSDPSPTCPVPVSGPTGPLDDDNCPPPIILT